MLEIGNWKFEIGWLHDWMMGDPSLPYALRFAPDASVTRNPQLTYKGSLH